MDKIKLRGETEANWILYDPILAERETVLTLNAQGVPTGIKAGDGVHKWSELAYLGGFSNAESDPIFTAWLSEFVETSQVNADWNATSGKALILNKPVIPPAGAQPVGNDGTLQFKSGTNLEADNGLIWDNSLKSLGVGVGHPFTPFAALHVGSSDSGKSAYISATRGSEILPALVAGSWATGSGWSFLTGPERIVKTAGSSSDLTANTGTIAAKNLYLVILTINSTVANDTIKINLGGQNAFLKLPNGQLTFMMYIKTISTTKLKIVPNSVSAFTISLASVTQLTTGGQLSTEKEIITTAIGSLFGTSDLIKLQQKNVIIGDLLANQFAGALLSLGGAFFTEFNTLDGLWAIKTTGDIGLRNLVVSGSSEIVRGNYRYDSQNFGVDTTGDWRTYSDANGFYTQYCTAGSSTKGGGTWVTKQTIFV